MNSAPESQVKILIHCPQCGGDIDFLEEAQVIHCQFCGSSLLVVGREGILRYVLPAQVREAQAAAFRALEGLRSTERSPSQILQTFLFYAPFWRMRGTAYRWIFGLKPMSVEIDAGVPPPMERLKVLLTRVLDHTVPGYSGLELGLTTLGVRSQVLHLLPFGREDLERRDSFLPLEISAEQVQAEADHFSHLFFEAGELVPEVVLDRLVGRSFSVIYFPLWHIEYQAGEGQKSLLLDAVGGSILGSSPARSLIQQKLKGEESRKSFAFSEIRFLPFRCPNCGWGFPFRPLSVLHFCPNCRRLFRESGGEWVETAYSVIPPPGGQSWEKLLWVPFWRCKAGLESNGERMETMAGLYQFAPPPRVVKPGEAQRPIYFYVPAVKFRTPQVLSNLASRLTYIQPEINPGSFPDGSHPVIAGGSLPDMDAQEMGPVVLGALIPQASQKARAWLKGCRIDLQEAQILYFPFAQADLFWKELSTGISFQRNALSEDLPESGGWK
jgi:DNA-directed RNA polymerase subunit RPC12/RpoP